MLALVLLSMLGACTVRSAPTADSSNWAPRCGQSPGGVSRLLPNPTNCRSVFWCDKGQPVQLYCPKGQVFDAKSQMCLKKKECSKNIEEQSIFLHCPYPDGKDVVMHPHPVVCTSFFVCVHGSLMERECNAGLHYNPSERTCDFPYRANCTARVLSKEP